MKSKLLIASVTALLLSALSALSACGGGGGSSSSSNNDTQPSSDQSKAAQGVFLDSAVEGLRYRSGRFSGLTDARGTFDYEVGQEVAFFIGGIVLGSAKGAPIITPLNLVPEVSDETNDTIVNLLHFLQSIDDDANPDNGILITALMRDVAADQNVTFNQNSEAFRSDGNVQILVSELTAVSSTGARSLIGETAALKHFERTMAGLNDERNSSAVKKGCYWLLEAAGNIYQIPLPDSYCVD